MDSNEIIAKALCADDDKLWHRSHDLWEQALIAIVKEKHADWYGISLVILGHIYDIMTKQFNFKMESSMQHFESEKKYQPVGHWANVKNNEDKISDLKSSNYSFIFKIILAIVLIILLFVVLSYPLNDFETKIMVGLGLLLFIIIGFIIGLLFNIFAGIVAFVGGCYFFDAICRLVANIFQLADGDMAMLYIFRIISVILAIYLAYSAFKGKDNNKEAFRLMVVTERERNYLKQQAKDCYSAIIEVSDELFREDMMEVSAANAFRACVNNDIYGFKHVTNMEDGLELINEIIAIRDYYEDMTNTSF